MVVEEAVDWAADDYWRNRRLSPAQLIVHDINVRDSWSSGETHHTGPLLEADEVFVSSLLPVLTGRDQFAETLFPETLTTNKREQQELATLAREYGWLNCLRRESFGSDDDEKVRWIHISSKFTEYLHGALLALTNWDEQRPSAIASLRRLDHCINQHERFSTHGRYFSPFFATLNGDDSPIESAPCLLSVPFLDWTVAGETPPLRFQIDPREGYQSSRSSSHLLRSILQHFYRLEDTRDREPLQVFSRHKPWLTDRELDLKVRRWYGQYPTGLNVDELWVLVIDSRHVITFSSNQTWKARWPPLQLVYRIADVSFRSIRNRFFLSSGNHDYSAYTHIITCLNGALGMLHRGFWMDTTLCLADRYASYLGHLQYRLHRSASAKLVMDLLQIQEELNIVIQLIHQQIDLLVNLQTALDQENTQTAQTRPRSQVSSIAAHPKRNSQVSANGAQASFHQLPSSQLSDPLSQLLDTLQREFADICDLRDNSDRLITRTIQLVNIRLEDHGKAVLVFTIVTIIFLPLSFVASYLGMNTNDIRNLRQDQSLFWIIAGSLTAGTFGLAMGLAFYGGSMVEWFVNWRAQASTPKPFSSRVAKTPSNLSDRSRGSENESSFMKSFRVLDGDGRTKSDMLAFIR